MLILSSMAPPHRSNNTTNTRATAGRDGPTYTASKSPSPHRNIDTSEPEEESQNSPKTKMQQLMEDMEGAQRKRRTANKQRVTKHYAKAHSDLRTAIATLFDTHQSETASAHTANLSRLTSLLRKKADIEKAMSEKLESLRRSYLTNSDALKKVLEYRCREFR